MSTWFLLFGWGVVASFVALVEASRRGEAQQLADQRADELHEAQDHIAALERALADSTATVAPPATPTLETTGSLVVEQPEPGPARPDATGWHRRWSGPLVERIPNFDAPQRAAAVYVRVPPSPGVAPGSAAHRRALIATMRAGMQQGATVSDRVKADWDSARQAFRIAQDRLDAVLRAMPSAHGDTLFVGVVPSAAASLASAPPAPGARPAGARFTSCGAAPTGGCAGWWATWWLVQSERPSPPPDGHGDPVPVELIDLSEVHAG